MKNAITISKSQGNIITFSAFNLYRIVIIFNRAQIIFLFIINETLHYNVADHYSQPSHWSFRVSFYSYPVQLDPRNILVLPKSY